MISALACESINTLDRAIREQHLPEWDRGDRLGLFLRGVMSTLGLRKATYYRGGRYHSGSVFVEDGSIAAISDGAPQPVADVEVDLTGTYLLPGFVDTHFHLTSLAVKMYRCDLSGAESADDVVTMLTEFASDAARSHVMGVEWDESRWPDAAFPTRTMLDSVDRERPVLARRICGHIGVANSALLAQLTGNEALIDRDTGLLREHAAWGASRLCRIGDGAVTDGIGRAIRELHEMGVTGIHDIVEPNRLKPYLDGLERSRAPMAIDILLHVHPADLGDYAEVASHFDTPHARIVGVKCFMDGSLGGRTAALHSPYADEGGTGTLLIEAGDLEGIVRGCADRGLTCAMHAIGDRAIDTILDVLEHVQPEAGHYRIEHCEMTGSRQIDRLAKAPVFLAMQPNFVRNWGGPGGLYDVRLGRERFESMNRFRTLVDVGLDVIFGSDGMPPGPMYGAVGATAHPSEPERLSMRETFDAFTSTADRVGQHGRGAGTIRPGSRADLVVWNRDPLTDPEARPQMVIAAGEVVVGGKRQA